MTFQHLFFKLSSIFFFHSLYVELYPFSSLGSFVLFPLPISADKYGLQLNLVCTQLGKQFKFKDKLRAIFFTVFIVFWFYFVLSFVCSDLL